MTDESNGTLTEGPIGRTLIRLAAPMLAGIVAVMLFGVIDTLYVGRLGVRELAAMSFTFPVTYLIMNIPIGIGIGLSSVVSRAIGSGNRNLVCRLATDGVLLAVLLQILVCLAGLASIGPLFRIQGADEELIPLIASYMVPWYLGVGFLIIPMVGNSALRATGDTRTPAMIMIIAGVVNIVLDPFLIFGIGPFPRLELQGAAIATVISWIVTFAISMRILAVREKLLVLRLSPWKQILESWRGTLYVGIPASATNMLIPITGAILTRIVSSFGTVAVAGYGVGTRIESLALITGMSMSAAMAPFIGQNFGAGNYARIRKALRFSLGFCAGTGAVFFLLILPLAAPVARLFNEDPLVVATATHYLWIVPLSYGAIGMIMQIAATFNATNRPLHSTLVSLARTLLFSLPLGYFGGVYWGVTGVFVGISAANLLTGALACFLVYRFLKSDPKRD